MLYQDDRERHEIEEWLLSDNSIASRAKHIDCKDQHQEGTGQWLLQSTQYQNWVHEDGKTLFYTGIPGAGETILSSTVIENIKTHIATTSPKEVRVVYLYCDYTDETQSISQFLFTLLGQLLGTLPSLSESIRAMYRDNRHVFPSIDNLSKALTHVTSSLTSDSHSRIFFVIDASMNARIEIEHFFWTILFAYKRRQMCRYFLQLGPMLVLKNSRTP